MQEESEFNKAPQLPVEAETFEQETLTVTQNFEMNDTIQE